MVGLPILLQLKYVFRFTAVALLYDHLLTLSSEIELFWHWPAKALGGTAIFMLNRLVGVCLAILVHVDSDLPHYTYAR